MIVIRLLGSFWIIVVFLCSHTLLSAQVHTIANPTFIGCQGLFTDSGGVQNDYGPNENFITTICPDGVNGTHLKLTFSGVDIKPGDEMCFFDGPNVVAPILTCASNFLPGAPFIIQATPNNVSGCITVSFNSNGNDQGKGWNAIIACTPACQAFEAIILSTDPIVVPQDTGWIDICPNETVGVNGDVLFLANNIQYAQFDSLCIYEWDFGDGNFIEGKNAQNTYTNPGGYEIRLTIWDQLGCKNTNFPSRKVRVAPPANLEFGSLPGPVCLGDTIALSAAVYPQTGGNITITPQTAIFDLSRIRADSLPLPDGNGASYQTTVSFNEFEPDKVLTNPEQIISICTNIEHSWMRDLRITLTCPSGQSAVLVNQEETGEEVFLGEPFEDDELLPAPIPGRGYTYCWNHNATNGTWLDYANTFNPQTLPAQTYNSYESLNNLIGCPLNGEWQLTVQDLWAIDNGYIFWWNITFADTLISQKETFTPNIINLDWVDQSNIIAIKDEDLLAYAHQVGEVMFRLEYSDDFNCSADTFVRISVLPPTHPECLDCEPNLTSTPDTSVCLGELLQFSTTSDYYQGDTLIFAAHPMHPIGFKTNPPASPYLSPIIINSVFPYYFSPGLPELEEVCFSLNTDPVNNIAVYLVAPDGTEMPLVTYKGGLGKNFTETCFRPDATNTIAGGTAPFTGDFRPEGNWQVFEGLALNGTWNLKVSDNFGINRLGLLENWRMTLHAANDLEYQWTPPIGLSCSYCPNPLATPQESTTYTLEVVDQYGCTSEANVIVSIQDKLTAPTLTCGESLPSGLTVSWNAVPGATGYSVNVNNEGWLPASAGLSHFIPGIPLGSTVFVQAKANDIHPSCPSDVATLNCLYFYCQMYAVVESSSPPSCYGGNDGEVFISAFDGTSPFVYSLDGITNQGIGYFNNVTAGDHFVEVIDGNGCIDTVFFTLGQPDPLTAEIIIDSVSCQGGNDGGASAMGNGGTPGYNYIWLTVPAVFSNTISNRPSGNYNLRITDDNNCIRDTVVFIPEPDPLQVALTIDSVLCHGAQSGAIEAIPTGGNPNYTYTWSNNIFTAQNNNLPAGNYTVTVTDVKNCTAVVSGTILEPLPNSYQIGAASPTCSNGTDGKAWVTIQQSNLPVTIQWLLPATGSSDTVSMLSSGYYEVVMTDSKGCPDTLGVSVADALPILLEVSTSPLSCPNSLDGTAEVNIISGGTGPFQFLWDDPGMQTTNFATNLDFGNYLVVVTDAQGCTESANATIVMADVLELTLETSPAACLQSLDGSASVIVSSIDWPFSYQWDDSSMSTDSALTNLNPGFYQVTVTTSKGCTATAGIMVDVLNMLKIDSFQIIEPRCVDSNDGSITVWASDGVGSLMYQWSGGGPPAAATLSGLDSGLYQVTVTDQGGCIITGEHILTGPSPIESSFSVTNVLCHGEATGEITISTTGGMAPYSYMWNTSPPSTQNTVSNLPTGNYQVTITDANSCEAVFDAQIEEPTAPLESTIIQTKKSCFDQGNNNATVQVSGCTGLNYTYLWSNQVTTSNNNQLMAGNYTVTVTDEVGCTNVSALMIEDFEPIMVTLNQTPLLCPGELSGVVEILSITGGSGMDILSNYSPTWSTNPSQTGVIISGLGGSNAYQVTITDSEGCTAIFNEYLDEPQPLSVELSINPVRCSGEQNGTLTILQTSGGTGAINYEWDPLLGGGQQALLTNVAAGTYYLRLIDGNQCIKDTLITVSEPLPISVLNLRIEEPKCASNEDGLIQVDAIGGNGSFTYSWNNGMNGQEINMLGTGIYQVTVADNQGCTATGEFILEEPEPLFFDLAFKNPDCSNKSNGEIEILGIGGSSPYQYAINNGLYQSTSVFGPLAQGSYTLSIMDNNGCKYEETTMLENPDAFTIDLGDDVTIYLGESVDLQATFTGNPPPSITWNAPYDGTLSCLNCFNPTSTPTFTITYTVVGTNENGCETTANITVYVIPKRTVLVPTAFTPNSDGSNDLLLVHGVEGIQIKTFQVFDRWGEKLFETSNFGINNSKIGWDGTFRGAEMNTGVYIWTLEVEHLDGLPETLSGQTTLIR